MTSATPKPRAGEHTKGPWRVDNSGYPTIIAGEQVVTRVNGSTDFDKDDRANARRIVACVNYLEGFKTEDLKQRRDNQASLLEERDALRSENAKLAAGSCVHELIGDPHGHFECSAVITLRALEQELVEALRKIAGCQSFADGDVVDIARIALGNHGR